jgi:hypothetical protein
VCKVDAVLSPHSNIMIVGVVMYCWADHVYRSASQGRSARISHQVTSVLIIKLKCVLVTEF